MRRFLHPTGGENGSSEEATATMTIQAESARGDREAIVRAMKRFVDSVRERATENVRVGRTPLPDERTLHELLASACADEGISPMDYDYALGREPDLQHLQDESLGAITEGATDPGPYDRLSSRDPADSWVRAHEPPRPDQPPPAYAAARSLRRRRSRR